MAEMVYSHSGVITVTLTGHKTFIFSPGQTYLVPTENAYIRTLIRKQYLTPAPAPLEADKTNE